MLMPLHYKSLREELNEILWHFNVPRKFYYRLIDLRWFLTEGVEIHSVEDNEKLSRAIEIIEQIMPRIRKEISI